MRKKGKKDLKISENGKDGNRMKRGAPILFILLVFVFSSLMLGGEAEGWYGGVVNVCCL
jgi:hypothetical protein